MTKVKGKKQETEDDDYDSPWKEAIENFFSEFMFFFFPDIAVDIDWERGYEFLNQELQKITRQASSAQGRVDKLVRVWRLSGEERLVYIHIEVQSQHKTKFAQRTFIYYYRIFDNYQKPVVTLVIFGDESSKWQPTEYKQELWGCKVNFEYPSLKLNDYETRLEELEQSNNPFAVVVQAHLHTKATKHKPEQRAALKWQLTRRLYEKGHRKEYILQLYHFIDWLMHLPAKFDKQFNTQLDEFEEERKVRYVTSYERFATQRGELRNARKYVLRGLDRRFGSVPPVMSERIKVIDNSNLLDLLYDYSWEADSISAFEQKLDEVTSSELSDAQIEE